ncbi:MAG: glycine cleavage system protein GcvH [Acidimicrobiia bacterium]
MANVPDDLYYTPQHEWLRVEGVIARVGISDFAQDALGDVVYVQAPELGAEVESMAPCGEVESTKSVSEVYSPVSGRVVEVNPLLSDSPQRVNDDPYGDGWIFAIEMSDPSEVERLLSGSAYSRLLTED